MFKAHLFNRKYLRFYVSTVAMLLCLLQSFGSELSENVQQCLNSGNAQTNGLEEQISTGWSELEGSTCSPYTSPLIGLSKDLNDPLSKETQKVQEEIYNDILLTIKKDAVKKILEVQHLYGHPKNDASYYSADAVAEKLCGGNVRFTFEKSCSPDQTQFLKTYANSIIEDLKDSPRGGSNKLQQELNFKIQRLNQNLALIPWTKSTNGRGYTTFSKTPKTKERHDEYLKAYTDEVSDSVGLFLLTSSSQDKFGSPRQLDEREQTCLGRNCANYKFHSWVNNKDTENSVIYLQESMISFANKVQRYSLKEGQSTEERLAVLIKNSPVLFGKYLRSNPQLVQPLCSSLSIANKLYNQRGLISEMVDDGGFKLGALAIGGAMLPLVITAAPVVALGAVTSATIGGLFGFAAAEKAHNTQIDFTQDLTTTLSSSGKSETLYENYLEKESAQTDLLLTAGLSGPAVAAYSKIFKGADKRLTRPKNSNEARKFLDDFLRNRKVRRSLRWLKDNKNVSQEEIGAFLSHLSLQTKASRTKMAEYMKNHSNSYLLEDLVKQVAKSCSK